MITCRLNMSQELTTPYGNMPTSAIRLGQRHVLAVQIAMVDWWVTIWQICSTKTTLYVLVVYPYLEDKQIKHQVVVGDFKWINQFLSEIVQIL